jgi:hypothetical protein
VAEVLHIEQLDELKLPGGPVRNRLKTIYRWRLMLACGHDVIEVKASDKRRPKRRGVTCPECGA